jgi:hypothetical protein
MTQIAELARAIPVLPPGRCQATLASNDIARFNLAALLDHQSDRIPTAFTSVPKRSNSAPTC